MKISYQGKIRKIKVIPKKIDILRETVSRKFSTTRKHEQLDHGEWMGAGQSQTNMSSILASQDNIMSFISLAREGEQESVLINWGDV